MIHLVKFLVKVIASLITIAGIWFLVVPALLMWDKKILDYHSKAMDLIWGEN